MSFTPHYSMPLHIYSLPRIHKENIRLRPTVSSLFSSVYELVRIHKGNIRLRPTVSSLFSSVYELSSFCCPIISPLSANKKFTVKDLKNLADTVKNLPLGSNYIHNLTEL